MGQNDESSLLSDSDNENEAPRFMDAAGIEQGETNTARPTTAAEEEVEHGMGSRWFILEPAVFLMFLARYMIGAVYQNQILYQTCITICHYNATQCEPLLGIERETTEAKAIEAEVQPYVTRILMTTSLLESIIPAFVSLFIGPWSDKFGRRPILLTTFMGYLTSAFILTTITLITQQNSINPWWFLLTSVPSILSGGTCALITGIYCYISDVAKSHARARRMVLNEASLCTGMMLGSVSSGYIYEATSAVTLFSIAFGLQLLALIYVYVFISESLKPEEIHPGSRIREFFSFELVKDLVRTCFKRRQNFDRAIIWLTMIALTIAIFTMEGEGTVNYLFLREQFGWIITDFSIFNASRIVVQIVGSIFGMIMLRRIFKVSIVTMSMLALASCVLESIVRATAVYWWEMYVGMTLGMMRGVLGPMCRAILSHVAPSSEVGKIYALTTSLESVSPLISAPIYTLIYNATLNYYPGAFNFISTGLYFLCYVLIAVIFSIQKSMSNTTVYQAIGS